MATTMRDCKTIQPLLSEYVDGTLAGETAWEVKLHCASCAVCTRIADDFTQTATLLRGLPELEPSTSFEAKLASRLADISLAPRRPSVWMRVRDGVGTLWTSPRVRPAFAMGAALAAVLPAAVVMTVRQQAQTGAPSNVRATPAVAQTDASLRDLWHDHIEYSASEPLGDRASVIAQGGEF